MKIYELTHKFYYLYKLKNKLNPNRVHSFKITKMHLKRLYHLTYYPFLYTYNG
jgi:hypothetical protein